MYTSKADPQDQRESKSKQECIPVGCVPTAAVSATCSFRGFMMSLPVWSHVPSNRGLPPEGVLPPPPTPWTDRRFWKHYLPLRSVIVRKVGSCAISGQIIEYCQFQKVCTLSKFNIRFYYGTFLPAKLFHIYYYLKPTNRRLLPS